MTAVLAAATLSMGAVALAGGSAQADQGDYIHKVYVCKYVQKPGQAEELKGGKNPILVDYHSTNASSPTIGTWFNDAQGRSFVVALEGAVPEPTIADCPKPGGESPTPEPSESPSVTPEPSESPSVTPEPSESPSVTPEPSESPSVTPEPSESPSVTPEPSESPSVTPEPSGTPTPTVAPTESPSAEPSRTPRPVLPSNEPSATPTAKPTATATPPRRGVPAATGGFGEGDGAIGLVALAGVLASAAALVLTRRK